MAEEKRKKRHTPEEKRIIQSKKRALRNKSLKSSLNTVLKQSIKAIKQKDAEEAPVLYKKASRKLDKMVTKGIIHKNAAARKKSQLSKKLKAIA
ncbi:MAG: 30S ribosomal protein S20 [Candidatus Muiribacteriota bacterium]